MNAPARIARIFTMMAFLSALPPLALAGNALTFGVLPYVSPGQLIKQHGPLKHYLAKTLRQPVVLVTAPGFGAFAERTRRGDYDIVFTAPHLGRLANTHDGYQVLARTGHQVRGMFIARRDSAIRRLEDLRGKRLMMAAPRSMLFLMGKETLRQHGLALGREVVWGKTRTHNNALNAPLRGKADAALTGIVMWRQLDPRQKKQLRLIGSTPPQPGFIMLAHPRLPKALATRIRQALLDFQHTAEGKNDFTTRALKGFAPIAADDLVPLDPYVNAMRETAS